MTATHAEIIARPHVVYRLRGKRGALLYVGCTSNLPLRVAEHRRNQCWGDRVARVEVSEQMPFAEARAVEKAAIIAERPRFNIEWTPKHRRGVSLVKGLR